MRELLRRIRVSWDKDTAVPVPNSLSKLGSPIGQCAVTALLIQDLFGGEIVRAEIDGFGSHYWNRIPEMGDIDLTREQLHHDVVLPIGSVISRKYLMEGTRSVELKTRERYMLLKSRVGKIE